MVLISNESSLVYLIIPIITSRMKVLSLNGNIFLIVGEGSEFTYSVQYFEATTTGLAIVSYYHMWMSGAM